MLYLNSNVSLLFEFPLGKLAHQARYMKSRYYYQSYQNFAKKSSTPGFSNGVSSLARERKYWQNRLTNFMSCFNVDLFFNNLQNSLGCFFVFFAFRSSFYLDHIFILTCTFCKNIYNLFFASSMIFLFSLVLLNKIIKGFLVFCEHSLLYHFCFSFELMLTKTGVLFGICLF